MPFAPTPLTYNSYLLQLSTMAVIPTTVDPVTGIVTVNDVNYINIMPSVLDYAELRIQRDLDLLQLQIGDYDDNFTIGSNILTIPVSDFVTLQTMSVIVGTKTIPMTPCTKEFLQNVYNDSSFTATPKYFAPYGGDAATNGATSQNFMIGPYPDQNYPILLTGTQRAPSLYQYAGTPQATTGTTFISEYLPDLLLMASMIFVSGYQRKFSSTGSDPQMPINYEQQYETLLKGAMGEELRKRFEASAWSSMAPSPAATPDRK